MIENAGPQINSLSQDVLAQNGITADVLRLDLLHPLVSGNKWYKLKQYLAEAREQHHSTIVTFGGAYSNHILATAAACKENRFSCVGIIRGEKPKNLSSTLVQAAALGMKLFYISREMYKEKIIPAAVYEQFPQFYPINEGGYGYQGMLGAQDILQFPGAKEYTHIMAAVGTGTTLAGLIEAADQTQQIIGVSALKNNFELENSINNLLTEKNQNRFLLLHDYHFGGYAHHTDVLLEFMNRWYKSTVIPSDFVYTGKLFFAFDDLCQRRFLPPASRILLIHSGGLQGNNSLKEGTLIF